MVTGLATGNLEISASQEVGNRPPWTLLLYDMERPLNAGWYLLTDHSLRYPEMVYTKINE